MMSFPLEKIVFVSCGLSWVFSVDSDHSHLMLEKFDHRE